MNIVTPILYTMLQLVVLVLIGFFIRKKAIWSSDFFASLGGLIVKVALPVYFFVKISSSDREELISSWIFPVAAVAIIFIGTLLGLLAAHFLPLGSREKRALAAMAGFGNSGYIPLSLVEIFPVTLPLFMEWFDETTALLYIGSYLIIFSPVYWSVGYHLITGKGESLSIKKLISPPLLGILAGFTVLAFNLQPVFLRPELPFFHLIKTAERLSQLVLPLVLITLGATIANLKVSGHNRKPLSVTAAVVTAVRLFLLPVIYYLVFFLFLRHMDLTPTQHLVLFLETHVPPGTNHAVMTVNAGINQDYAAFTLMVSYIAFLIVFPLSMMIFLQLPGII